MILAEEPFGVKGDKPWGPGQSPGGACAELPEDGYSHVPFLKHASKTASGVLYARAS